MHQAVKSGIRNLIRDKLIAKVENYKPESEHKPFFSAIFSEDKVLTASLVHSFYTSFGMSIYEQLTLMLAQAANYHVEKQYRLEGDIDLRTSQLIDELWESDKSNGSTDKLVELKQIRDSIYPARQVQIQNDSVVDIFLRKLLVQDDFWNLVGGSESTYDELIAVFKEVGREISELIDAKFK